jgi:transcriptional regulator with XRE-family HTH domain
MQHSGIIFKTRKQASMNNFLNVHIGAKIRAKRLELGFGCSDFAKQAHIDVAHLSKVERGEERLTPTQAAAACELLGTQVAWLFEDAPQAGGNLQLPASPHVDYAVKKPDRQELMDNFDRLPTAQQEELVNLSFALITEVVGKAKSWR